MKTHTPLNSPAGRTAAAPSNTGPAFARPGSTIRSRQSCRRIGLRRFVPVLLALLVSWLAGPAFGQGTGYQTIDWAGTTEPVLTLNQAYPLSAVASSGLPVTLRVEFGPATLANGLLTVTGPRLVQVTAEQSGDETYRAIEETRSFNFRKAAVTHPGGLDTSGNAFSVWVEGNLAYVADGDSGLQVIDVSNPAGPVRVGGFNTSGSANAVQVRGNFAYVADGDSGLQVINVSNPASPVRAGGFNTSGIANAVHVVGNNAYVADGNAGLQVIDISVPASPTRLGGFATAGNASEVKAVGSIAYVLSVRPGAATGARIEVIDVGDPASPVRTGSLDLDSFSSAYGLDAAGNHLYVASGSTGLLVIDVSNPATPVQVGSFNDYAGVPFSGSTYGVHVDGDIAYMTHQTLAGLTVYSGLTLIDVSNPARPHEAGGFVSVDSADNISTGLTTGTWWGVRVAGDVAYVAGGASGLETFAVRKGFPQTLTWAGVPGPELALNTSYPLRASSSSGLAVSLNVVSGPGTITNGQLTVTGPGTVQVVAEQGGDTTYLPVRETRVFNLRGVVLSSVGRQPGGARGRAIDVVGNYAYLAAWDLGLEVVDVSDPARPVRAGGYDTAGLANDVQVAGNHAFVADGQAGLQVIDVSNPANPVRTGGFNTSGEAGGVQVVGNYAVIADGQAGLQVIDVSNPANPVRTGGFNTSGNAYGVRVVGNLAYVADGDRGLVILDVSIPSSPVRVGIFNTGGIARSVDVAGNFAFVADGREGLQVIDVSNPVVPVRVSGLSGEYEISTGFGDFFQPRRVRVAGNLAFVTSLNFGSPAHILDVSNPANPIRLALFVEDAMDARLGGDRLYVTGGSGFEVLGMNFGDALPALGIRPVGQQVELSWAVGSPGLRLQSRATLASDSAWENVTAPTVETDGRAHVSLDVNGPHRYFRLFRP